MSGTGFTLVAVSKRGFADRTARNFQTLLGGRLFEGLVIRKGGGYFAYQNLCKHLPVTLDLRDGQVFTHDKEKLLCHLHGAVYEIETGLCTAGPCVGASLRKLEVVEEESRLVIRIPNYR